MTAPRTPPRSPNPSQHRTRARTCLPTRTLRTALLALALAAAAVSHAAVSHAAVSHAAVSGTATGISAVPAGQLALVTGGTCTTCGGSGGGGGGTGSSGSPVATGSPYWVTYRVTLDSSYYSPATLASRVNNWSGSTITGSFGYTRKVVRDVQFSGGFASFVRASIGGEVSTSTSASVRYGVPPMSYGKLYVKYYTARKTYYGHRYQAFSDGSRSIIASDHGPLVSTTTVLGYVTGPL